MTAKQTNGIPLSATVKLGSWSVQTVFAQGSTADPTVTQVHSYAVCNNLTTTNGSTVHVTAPTGPPDQATSATGGASCGAGQLLTEGGFFLGYPSDQLVVTDFAADYTDTPSRWVMTLYSLPGPGIDTYGNFGGSASLISICVTSQ